MNAREFLSERQRRMTLLGGLAATVAVLACVLVWLVAAPGTYHSLGGGVVYDDAAVQTASASDIEAALDEKVEAGMINISINAEPVFANGGEPGNLQIENNVSNNYPQKVRIVADDSGQMLYESGLVPVGSKIAMDTLDVDLDAGTYACTAYFSSVDPETGTELGRAGANISISVLS